MAGFLDVLDAKGADIVSEWDIYTIIMGVAICALIAYSLSTSTDPDIHPMILTQQSYASRVRREGESAVYRAPDVPDNYPLRSGLAVKDPNAPPYSGTRDGDLRDIWKRVTGELPMPQPRFGENRATGREKGKLVTVHGKEEFIDHDIDCLTKELAIIGYTVSKNGGKTVAVYHPNSIEFLCTVFGKLAKYYLFQVGAILMGYSLFILWPERGPHSIQPTSPLGGRLSESHQSRCPGSSGWIYTTGNDFRRTHCSQASHLGR